ncbi:Ig-like domain-containing protein [Microlunatus parietis]|uniref:Bacterial Ig domain-containing protein n=1 Tax=Microlunatus parietis TaxID=682979 RepID=A0A7Y9IE46_9ACTN|nr:Ig-like domain-containing protein [Microlunatus parietis]NYE75110.1 hypothetical protein [Microlunatus parietis]
MVGSLALATPAAADPAADASTQADIKPLVLDQIPADGSNPSAKKTIWLNFGGGTVTNTNWNDLSGYEELKFEPADKLSDAQKLEAYQRMVQAYAPFDVNVTTKKPAKAKLERSSMDDEEYGGIAHITDSNSSSAGFEKIFVPGVAAGKGVVSGFGDPYEYDTWTTTDVFGDAGNGKLKQRGKGTIRKAVEARDVRTYLGRLTGDIAVHEVGHTLGLDHQGWDDGETKEEYYSPGADWTEASASVWGPTMGSPIASMHRWSGAYPNNSKDQDDLAVMTKKLSEKDATKKRLYDKDGKVYWGAYCTNSQTGEVVKGDSETDECYDDEPLKWQNDLRGRVTYRDNQESNTDSRARALTIQDGKADAWGEFVKNLGDGVGNWYRFDAAAGPISVAVTPQQPFTALDLKVTLYDSELKQLATDDPEVKPIVDDGGHVVVLEATGQDAKVDHLGTGAQTYFVKVEQASLGSLNSNTVKKAGASPKYGNLGVYQLAVQGTAAAELAPPAVDPTYGETVAGTGVAGATVEVQDADGKVIGTAEVGADGKYSVTLDPAAKEGDELLVSQAKDGQRSRPASVTVITEEKPEVKVKVDPSKITEGDDGGVTVVGTGFAAGQKVSGVVNSEPVELGTKIADDDGKVEFVFDGSKLEVGKHKVTLTADDDKDYTGSATLTVVKADDEPSPKPSDDETPSPEPSDDETPSPAPSDDETTPPPSDDNGGDDDGGLPSTGASTALTLFGIGGIVLVGSGVTIAAAARRRNKA